MKKKQIIALLLGLVVLAVGAWLLSGASAKNLKRQEVIIDVKDSFEK